MGATSKALPKNKFFKGNGSTIKEFNLENLNYFLLAYHS
jgi:hypothetical protein